MNPHPVVTAAIELQPLIREHLVTGEKRARLAAEVVSAVGQACSIYSLRRKLVALKFLHLSRWLQSKR